MSITSINPVSSNVSSVQAHQQLKTDQATLNKDEADQAYQSRLNSDEAKVRADKALVAASTQSAQASPENPAGQFSKEFSDSNDSSTAGVDVFV